MFENKGELKVTEHRCEYCDRIFSRKYNLQTHLKSCEKLKATRIAETVKLVVEKDIDSYRLENEKLMCNVEDYKIKYDEAAKLNKMLQNKHSKRMKIAENNLREKDDKITELENKILELEKNLEYGKGILVGIDQAKPTKNVKTNYQQ